MRYALWCLFALVIFIPATVINAVLWKLVCCEWDRPYGRTK